MAFSSGKSAGVFWTAGFQIVVLQRAQISDQNMGGGVLLGSSDNKESCGGKN